MWNTITLNNIKSVITIISVMGAFGINVPAYAEVKLPIGLSFGSTIFADMTSKSDNKNTNYDTTNGFHITRAYLYMIDQVTDNITAKIVLDTSNAPVAGASTFLKNAYMDYMASDFLTIRSGIADTPWISFEDKMYGFRYSGSVFADKVGAEKSADGGFSLIGGSSGFSYHVGMYNGEYFNAAPNGAGLAYQGRLGYEFDNGIGTAVFYHGETKRSGTANYNPTRAIAMLYYRHDTFTLAGEYLIANDFNGTVIPTGAKFADANGYCVWLAAKPVEQVHLLARYDSMTNVTRRGVANANVTATAYTVGAAYVMAKGQEVGLFYNVTDDGLVNGTQANTISINMLTGF